jgi:hypothetical protein
VTKFEADLTVAGSSKKHRPTMKFVPVEPEDSNSRENEKSDQRDGHHAEDCRIDKR